MSNTLLSEQNPLQKLRKRYISWTIALVVFGFLIFCWNLLVVVGVYNLNLGYRWAYLTMTEWMYVGWILFALFIFMEIAFFAHYYSLAQKQRTQPTMFQPQMMFKGKKLLVYTHPVGVQGGIFTKTHVKINDDTILNIRIQIIPGKDLWP